MSEPIKRISIEGFKSIRKLDIELKPLNVLIGANGAGKSNFVDFFGILRAMIERQFQDYINKNRPTDGYFYNGVRYTKHIKADLFFGEGCDYHFTLEPTKDSSVLIATESGQRHGQKMRFGGSLESQWWMWGFASGRLEAFRQEGPPPARWRRDAPQAPLDLKVYHFHDTSMTAGMRRQGAINDNEYLRQDGENLAAFLYGLQQAGSAPIRSMGGMPVRISPEYSNIRDVVRLAAPYFDDFKLRPVTANPELIQLEWTQKGSDYPFRPSQLSDGTLRFICLATALLQPNPPATMLFDEPELGLHPYALTLLASMFKQTAKSGRQVIVCTQSAALLNEFEPQDVIVVDRADGQSTFRRLEQADLSEWLKDYSLADLWQKNILGGRPGGIVERSPSPDEPPPPPSPEGEGR